MKSGSYVITHLLYCNDSCPKYPSFSLRSDRDVYTMPQPTCTGDPICYSKLLIYITILRSVTVAVNVQDHWKYEEECALKSWFVFSSCIS